MIPTEIRNDGKRRRRVKSEMRRKVQVEEAKVEIDPDEDVARSVLAKTRSDAPSGVGSEVYTSKGTRFTFSRPRGPRISEEECGDYGDSAGEDIEMSARQKLKGELAVQLRRKASPTRKSVEDQQASIRSQWGAGKGNSKRRRIEMPPDSKKEASAET